MKYIRILKKMRTVFNALPQEEQEIVLETVNRDNCIQLEQKAEAEKRENSNSLKLLMHVPTTASTEELQERFMRFMNTGKLKLKDEESILSVTLMEQLFREMLSIKTIRKLTEEKYPEILI